MSNQNLFYSIISKIKILACHPPVFTLVWGGMTYSSISKLCRTHIKYTESFAFILENIKYSSVVSKVICPLKYCYFAGNKKLIYVATSRVRWGVGGIIGKLNERIGMKQEYVEKYVINAFLCDYVEAILVSRHKLYQKNTVCTFPPACMWLGG